MSYRASFARNEDIVQRNEEMIKLSAEGVRLRVIAEQFGISKQRVSQIVNNPNALVLRKQAK